MSCFKQGLVPTQEAFVRKVNRIYEEINEQNVEELYEFMSEEDMKNATPPFSEILATVVSFSQVERIVPT